MCSYIAPVQFNRQQNIFPCNKMVVSTKYVNGGSVDDNIWTLLFYLYLCHLLEFNSHLTSERRSTEITDDYSSSQIYRFQTHF